MRARAAEGQCWKHSKGNNIMTSCSKCITAFDLSSTTNKCRRWIDYFFQCQYLENVRTCYLSHVYCVKPNFPKVAPISNRQTEVCRAKENFIRCIMPTSVYYNLPVLYHCLNLIHYLWNKLWLIDWLIDRRESAGSLRKKSKLDTGLKLCYHLLPVMKLPTDFLKSFFVLSI